MNYACKVLLDTPWWVYLLLGYLVSIGIKASKIRVVHIKRLFIMPAFFLYLSIHTLLTIIKPSYFTIASWLIALTIGAALGWWQVSRYKLQIDRINGLIQIPGTWSMLIIILVLFAIKYYFNYQIAVNPQQIGEIGFELNVLAVSGGCSGFFIGKLLGYLYRLRIDPSIELANK